MEGAYPTPLHSFNHYTYPQHDRGLEELILSNQIGGGFRDTLTSIHDSTASVTAAVDRNGLAGVTETARAGSINLQSTERNGGEVRSSVERTAGDTRASVERNAGEIRAGSERNHGETRAHLDRLQISVAGDICDVRREAVEHKYQLSLQAADIAAKAALQASENACTIRAQIAECCCEMKELVRAENGATRELMNSQEQSRLRDALADAKQNMLLLQLGGGPGNSGK